MTAFRTVRIHDELSFQTVLEQMVNDRWKLESAGCVIVASGLLWWAILGKKYS